MASSDKTGGGRFAGGDDGLEGAGRDGVDCEGNWAGVCTVGGIDGMDGDKDDVDGATSSAGSGGAFAGAVVKLVLASVLVLGLCSGGTWAPCNSGIKASSGVGSGGASRGGGALKRAKASVVT